MQIVKHILFPFDFSEQSSRAIPFVQSIARRFDARITVLSVIPPVWGVSSPGMPFFTDIGAPEVESSLQARLDAALAEKFPGIAVERITRSGDPALVITEFAHNHDVDLIMMPTHGCGLFRSVVIGSVTAKVLHDAKCPVWTATHAEEQRSPDVPRTILCAVDGTPETQALMQWAAEFSQKMGASLKLLHVVPPISDWLGLSSERELQEEVREKARAGMEALQRSAGVEAPLRVVVGPIAQTVAEEAAEERADLVLIGRGSLPSTLGRLQTHAYGIIQKSRCPVLSA